MIIWGGFNFSGTELDTGGRYNPITNSWTGTDTTSAPAGRSYHSAIWTGTEMIVWAGYTAGGVSNTGGRYDPTSNTWINTGNSNAPSSRTDHTAVWTGSEMIVWGGGGPEPPGNLNTGGKYLPSIDSWTDTNTANAPPGRFKHTAVWTGIEMVVWGGGTSNGFTFNSGGKYNPGSDRWTPTSTTNAPSARSSHTAVWTGTEMIVWGGSDTIVQLNKAVKTIPALFLLRRRTPTPIPRLNTGARYNPDADSWDSDLHNKRSNGQSRAHRSLD